MRLDFDPVASKLSISRLVGKESIFARGTYVQVKHMDCFENPNKSFLRDLLARDRRKVIGRE